MKHVGLSEGEAVLEGDDFDGLPKELVLAVVADRELNVSEEVVFEAVVSWKESNKGNGSVRNAVADVMPHLQIR